MRSPATCTYCAKKPEKLCGKDSTEGTAYGIVAAGMNNLLRFSDYDLLAYLACGFTAMALYDTLAGTHLVMGSSWTIGDGLAAIIGAYVLGQVLASPPSLLLERGLVRGLLGRPSEVLLRPRPKTGVRALLANTIMGEYFIPLEGGLAHRVRAAAGDADAVGEGLFWRAFAAARADVSAAARLESFLRLYGFCRNFAFIAMIGAVAFAATAISGAVAHAPYDAVAHDWWMAAGAGVIAIGMLQRYLKFHRLYTVEAFVAFAATAGKGSSQ